MGIETVDVDIIRGGTSKGVFVALTRLPADPERRDAFVLALLGSPDPMQLDGLGGTHSSTSKVMAVATAWDARAAGYDVPDDVEVAYLFAQGSVVDPVVDWGGNCGNLTPGVAVYAALHGMVRVSDPITRIKMFNLNTGALVRCDLPVSDGAPRVEGDFRMPGVPGTGARIDVTFSYPAQSSRRPVFSTGRVVEEIQLDGRSIEATIIDVTNPVVIVRSADLGIAGDELPDALNRDADFLERVERIRAEAAYRIGIVDDPSDAWRKSPAIPRVIFVAPPRSHTLADGSVLGSDAADVVGRTSSVGRIHHAFTGTGMMAVAAARRLRGTVLNLLVHESAVPRGSPLRFAHPKGVVSLDARVTEQGRAAQVESVTLARTSRRLLTGVAEIRMSGTEGDVVRSDQ